jgi:hypothetical protein
MSDIKDGGPAFPREADEAPDQRGMSLRDYFAAKALVAEIMTTCSDATPESAEDAVRAARKAGLTITEHLAQNAYTWADAMLRARERA